MKKLILFVLLSSMIIFAGGAGVGGKGGSSTGGSTSGSTGGSGSSYNKGGSGDSRQNTGDNKQNTGDNKQDSGSSGRGDSTGGSTGGSTSGSTSGSGKSGHDGGTVSSYSDENYTYESGTFTFNQDFVWVDFNRRIDLLNQTSSSISVNDIASMGYYDINDDGSVGEYVELYNQEGTESTVIFQKDQTVGIYMDINGKRYTTTNTSDDSTTGGTNIDPDSVNEEDQYFCLFTQGVVSGGSAHYEYYFDGMESSSDSMEKFIEDLRREYGEDIAIIVDGKKYEDPIGTSGQPLPGIFATVLVGAGCGLLIKKKRKK